MDVLQAGKERFNQQIERLKFLMLQYEKGCVDFRHIRIDEESAIDESSTSTVMFEMMHLKPEDAQCNSCEDTGEA